MYGFLCGEYQARNFVYLRDSEMAKVLNVSRDTVIQAKKCLVLEGYIKTDTGKYVKHATRYTVLSLSGKETRQPLAPKPDIGIAQNPTSTTKVLTTKTFNDKLPLTARLVPVPSSLLATALRLEEHREKKNRAEYTGTPFPSREVLSMDDRYHEVRGKVYGN